MIFIVILSVIAIFIFLIRFYLLKRELKHVSQQLNQINKKVISKKIDLAFYDKDLESLAAQINEQIDLTNEAITEKLRTKNELKQAIASISHDIRTPMTSILGNIQFLEYDDITPEKSNQYITNIKNGALRLKDLLDDFFELSIIESPDYPLKKENIKLNTLLLDSLISFYDDFQKAQIEPNILILEEDIYIMADSSAVKRVLENLITNAIKHSSEEVTFQLIKHSSAVQLNIMNPAKQLTEGDIPFLFDRFYKVDQARRAKGAGLGLFIAKSLMTKMEGNLSAELIGDKLKIKCEWKTEQ
ncbi:HAMP domain-containing histidine kinase [Bacillus sp. Ab-1751]|uniref:ATP-binding protein n=1 Tax=Bacillus sp. Ab-1751 TaxID=2608326 RepID=UPI00141EA2B5|nr:HAMP domain-containing histidine kinase [Bacillus sp. Ab-1751]